MPKQYFHICNPSTPEISGCKIIFSKKDLQQIKDDSNAIYLLHVHLNWEGNKLSNNYGFDIANLIRTEKKSKAPIIFYSAIQQEYFEHKSKNDIKYKILFGRGSAFIEAPFKEVELNKLAESIEPLSKEALHDVVTMLCDLQGMVIDKLNHDLRFGADIDMVFSSIISYLSSLQKDNIHFIEYAEKLKTNNKSDFDSYKEAFIKICKRKLVSQPLPDVEREKTPFTILVLDDVQEELEKFENYLGNSFSIIKIANAKEAVSVLGKDTSNSILAVIADWRLYIDGTNTYWQPLQGYEVIEFAARNGFRAVFALTSQDEDIIHDIRNMQGIRYQLYKKQNLQNADQWKILGNVISEFCYEMLNAWSNLPDSDNWKKDERSIDNSEAEKLRKKCPERSIIARKEKGEEKFYVSYPSLHIQYLQYLHSPEKQVLFDRLDNKADEVWQYLLKMKNTDGIFEEVEILREKFGLSTPKDSSLFPTLVLRRIWIALWYFHVDRNESLFADKETKYSKLIFSIIQNNGNLNFQGNKHSAEQTKLCISIDQVKARKVLPEERTWLKKWGLIE